MEHGKLKTRSACPGPRSNSDLVLSSQVDVKFHRMTKRFLPLSELKKLHLQHRGDGGPLRGAALFTRARLSVQPLTSGV